MDLVAVLLVMIVIVLHMLLVQAKLVVHLSIPASKTACFQSKMCIVVSAPSLAPVQVTKQVCTLPLVCPSSSSFEAEAEVEVEVDYSAPKHPASDYPTHPASSPSLPNRTLRPETHQLSSAMKAPAHSLPNC